MFAFNSLRVCGQRSSFLAKLTLNIHPDSQTRVSTSAVLLTPPPRRFRSLTSLAHIFPPLNIYLLQATYCNLNSLNTTRAHVLDNCPTGGTDIPGTVYYSRLRLVTASLGSAKPKEISIMSSHQKTGTIQRRHGSFGRNTTHQTHPLFVPQNLWTRDKILVSYRSNFWLHARKIVHEAEPEDVTLKPACVGVCCS